MESKRKSCGKIHSPYLLRYQSHSDFRVGCSFSSMQVSWLARHRSGAFSDLSNGLAFAPRLQWRDRTGLEPVSLFAELLRNIESIQLQ
jgi:hypothetical protein